MKPTNRLPILAQHVSRTVVKDGKTMPLQKLFTTKAFDRLLPVKINNHIYPNGGWEIIEGGGSKKKTEKVEVPPEAVSTRAKHNEDGKVRAKNTTRKSANSDKESMGGDSEESKTTGTAAVVDGGSGTKATTGSKSTGKK